MKKPGPNLSASVKEKLLQLSRATGRPNIELLDRYCIERLLYRLSKSRHRERFVLKGALMLLVWGGGSVQRVTRDADLLGLGDSSIPTLRSVFQDICRTPVEDDGVVFDAESVEGDSIRAHEEYGGVRLRLKARLGSALVRVQVDVGFGDAFNPVENDFPTLLGFPSPHLRMYSRENSVAEKFEAMVRLGMANSRMKDYFDLWHLSRKFPFDGKDLGDAIRATFQRRATELPADIPLGLSDEFGHDSANQTQWRAFWKKSVRLDPMPEFNEVVVQVRDFLLPAVAARGATLWRDGGPWAAG
jgi:predicted nucleotidyltransferase component of viral defense system